MGDHHRTAAIVSTGDEIVLGQTLDTNSGWLSARLLESGIPVREHSSLPDDEQRLGAAIARLGAAHDLVIVTGGLGPTADDLSRSALASVLHEPLVEDESSLAAIRRWFEGRSRPMPRGNAVQALRPRSATSLANPHGTAPGLLARVGWADVFCLPGPPREMRPMFEAEVLPRLRIGAGRKVATRVLPTFGLGESDIASRLGPLMDRSRNPLVGTTASGGVVTCRLRYEGEAGACERALDEAERGVRAALGECILGVGERTIQEFVVELLRLRGRMLAVVESCTGGLLGAMVTEVAGSSAVFVGGWVTYSNQLKRAAVGVPESTFGPGGPGAVSEACARSMAQGGLDRAGTTDALAITGVAGPLAPGEAEDPEKPVGTVWIAHASRDLGIAARRFRFTGGRAAVREWAARTALAMLRLRLLGHGGARLPGQV